jgi:hypothetical protein
MKPNICIRWAGVAQTRPKMVKLEMQNSCVPALFRASHSRPLQRWLQWVRAHSWANGGALPRFVAKAQKGGAQGRRTPCDGGCARGPLGRSRSQSVGQQVSSPCPLLPPPQTRPTTTPTLPSWPSVASGWPGGGALCATKIDTVSQNFAFLDQYYILVVLHHYCASICPVS